MDGPSTRAAETRAPKPRLARVGILVNPKKEAARNAVDGFCRWLRSRSVEPVVRSAQALDLGGSQFLEADSFFRDPDLIVSLGGDGTFLHLAHHVRASHPALLGVNFGRLGFLTAVEASELVPFFERILASGLPIENRMRLACSVAGVLQSPYALNDVVLQDAEHMRTMTIRLRCGEATIGVFTADGVIIASPTGSTAYTLSVGGPVVHPHLEAILIAFLSAHTLSARPVVLSANETVTAEVSDPRPLRLVIDGQVSQILAPGSVLSVARAPAPAAVVIDPERSFIDRLRLKLAWGGNQRA
jgi:NAD+ kinase